MLRCSGQLQQRAPLCPTTPATSRPRLMPPPLVHRPPLQTLPTAAGPSVVGNQAWLDALHRSPLSQTQLVIGFDLCKLVVWMHGPLQANLSADMAFCRPHVSLVQATILELPHASLVQATLFIILTNLVCPALAGLPQLLLLLALWPLVWVKLLTNLVCPALARLPQPTGCCYCWPCGPWSG